MTRAWELGRPLWSNRFGSWRVVHRPVGYRDAPVDTALLWRFAGDASDAAFVELALEEFGWAAEQIPGPVFQRVLERGTDRGPYLVAERVDAVPARRLVEGRPRLPVEAVMAIGRTMCGALASLGDLRDPNGDPIPMEGFCLGLDHLWLSDATVRIANPILATRFRSLGAYDGPRSEDVDCVAPEVLRGERGETESDVYSVALVMLALLVGRSPLLRETARETMAAVLQPELAESTLALGALDALPATRAALLRGLDPVPRKRPPTPSAFAEQLEDAARADGLERVTPEDLVALVGLPPELCGVPAL